MTGSRVGTQCRPVLALEIGSDVGARRWWTSKSGRAEGLFESREVDGIAYYDVYQTGVLTEDIGPVVRDLIVEATREVSANGVVTVVLNGMDDFDRWIRRELDAHPEVTTVDRMHASLPSGLQTFVARLEDDRWAAVVNRPPRLPGANASFDPELAELAVVRASLARAALRVAEAPQGGSNPLPQTGAGALRLRARRREFVAVSNRYETVTASLVDLERKRQEATDALDELRSALPEPAPGEQQVWKTLVDELARRKRERDHQAASLKGEFDRMGVAFTRITAASDLSIAALSLIVAIISFTVAMIALVVSAG